MQLVCQRAGYLQQRAAKLQQLGLTPAEVAALAWRLPELLLTDTAARVASKAAVLQQELGLPAAEVVGLVTKGKPSWLTSSVTTLRERALALAGVSRVCSHHVAHVDCCPSLWLVHMFQLSVVRCALHCV